MGWVACSWPRVKGFGQRRLSLVLPLGMPVNHALDALDVEEGAPAHLPTIRTLVPNRRSLA
jgi:hypothetical protein